MNDDTTFAELAGDDTGWEQDQADMDDWMSDGESTYINSAWE